MGLGRHIKSAVCFVLLAIVPPVAQANDCDKLELPIAFDEFGLPHLTLKINQHQYRVLFDLGSAQGIHWPADKSHLFKKLRYTGNTINSVNIVGEVTQNKAFVIPQLSLDCMSFSDVAGVELTPWAASLGKKPEPKDESAKSDEVIPVIGRGFFKGKFLTIDYLKRRIIVHKSTNIKSATAGILTLPYNDEPEGITIALSSSNKIYAMALDSGSSMSIMVASKVSPKEKTESCDIDLGPDLICNKLAVPLTLGGKVSFTSDIIMYPIDDKFTMDGLLGSDFFHAFSLEVDLVNSKLTLTKSD